MKSDIKRIIAAVALCMVICMACSACAAFKNEDAVPFSDEALLDFLHGLMEDGETSGGILFARAPGEKLAPVVDDAIYRLHSSDYALARFISTLSWTTHNRLGGLLLKAECSYASDYSVRRLHDICPGMKLPEYDATKLTLQIEEAVLVNAPRVWCAYAYTDILVPRVGGLIEGISDRSGICGYYVDETTYTTQQYGDGVEIVINLSYAEDCVPYDELPIAKDEYQAVDCILDVWESGGDTAVFRVQVPSWTHETMFDICNTAEANLATIACESDYMHCSLYPRNGADRIAEVWLSFEMASAQLTRYETELESALDEYEAELRALGETDTRELYRAIHDLVLSACEYDDDVADATLDETLTVQQHALRTAYGALVKGDTVCTGYARAYRALCQRMGLPCWVVYGEQDGGGHAWNMVRVEDELLFVDCTFDDTGGGSRHEYFLLTRDEMQDNGYIVDEGFVMPPLR